MTVIVLFSALATTANAATVSVVAGKEVGLGDSFYWAGIVILNIDGKEYPGTKESGTFVLEIATQLYKISR